MSTNKKKSNIMKTFATLVLSVITLTITTVTCFAVDKDVPVTSEAINAWMESGCLNEDGIPFTSCSIDAWLENGCSSSEPVGQAVINFIENKSNSIQIVE